MLKKTISGHYDSVFSMEHNNRLFIPKNVDPARTKDNYNCIVCGDVAYVDPMDPRFTKDFWENYAKLNALYWSNRALADALEYERYRETMRKIWMCRRAIDFNPTNEVEAFFYLLFLPLILYADIILTTKELQAEWEHAEFKCDRKLQNFMFKEAKFAAREIIGRYDAEMSKSYLETMDCMMKETAKTAENYVDLSERVSFVPRETERFATLEEIYAGLYEPAFREFQSKQRPCRRYKGTYLEYIREGQQASVIKKKQNRSSRNRKPAEALEIVFGIGDMDNTGYAAAYQDAKKSEALLRKFCDHLMHLPNVCFVTTKDLKDQNWQPPFKNGLIILNLVAHFDEATPGVHLTVIPYSRDCKRGPAVQACLGRAMAGMGYPSTWKDALDENGERIPKRTRTGELVLNKDGTIRYQQEPDKQGIIDWIEEQKDWIQKEMEIHYGWEREYKGSHPRGNLSTPDYQVARAAERKREIELGINKMLNNLIDEINTEIERLDTTVDKVWRNSSGWDLLLRYLEACSEEEYLEYVRRAEEHLAEIPARAQEDAKKELNVLIDKAREKNAKQVSKKETSHSKQTR